MEKLNFIEISKCTRNCVDDSILNRMKIQVQSFLEFQKNSVGCDLIHVESSFQNP